MNSMSRHDFNDCDCRREKNDCDCRRERHDCDPCRKERHDCDDCRKERHDCDDCRKERKHCPTIIKCGCPSSTVITSGAAVGDKFTVSSLTLNTCELCNPCVKLEFASNIIVPTGFTGAISLQVFKSCNNQFNPTPVGSVWNLSPAAATSSTFSFFLCDCDSCFNGCCTYTVLATVTTKLGDGPLSINNAELAAIATCGIAHQCC